MMLWAIALTQARWLPSSDHNFVVQVDFEGTLPKASTVQSTVTIADVPLTCSVLQKSVSTDKSKRYIIDVRLRPFKHLCWTVQESYWSHEVCFGNVIKQFAVANPAQQFKIGTYAHTIEEPRALREVYENGTDGRSATILYKCGRWNPNLMTLHEPSPLKYEVTVYSPSLCYEVEKTPNLPFTDMIFREPPGAALLEILWGYCWKLTKGWWTYEYCYPNKFMQYHLSDDENIEGDIYSLGAIFPRERNSDTKATPDIHADERAGRTSVEYNSGDLLEVADLDVGTRLGFYVDRLNSTAHRVKIPLQVGHEVVDSSAIRPMRSVPVRMGQAVNGYRGRGSFLLDLSNGTRCDETDSGRATTMIFVCSPNWDDTTEPVFKATEIVSITETSVCEYEVLVSTPAVCPHPRLLPVFSQQKEQIISCARAN